jgi:hypothetical protein
MALSCQTDRNHDQFNMANTMKAHMSPSIRLSCATDGFPHASPTMYPLPR